MQLSKRRSRKRAKPSRRSFLEPLEARQLLAVTLAPLPASDITLRSATIGVDVQETGAFNPTVSLYWGDDDAGEEVSLWDHSVDLKAVPVGQYTTDLSELEVATTYYYRAFALDIFGGEFVWTDVTSFSTLPPGLAQIQHEATSFVGGTTAQISGRVLDNGGDTPTVSVYFGTIDGGDNADAWQQSQEVGPFDGAFAHRLKGLLPNTPYHYRIAAENASGIAWTDSLTLTTVDVPALRISEFMAANASTALSRTRPATEVDFPRTLKPYDWIEIQNNTAEPTDIGGYHLTDSRQLPLKWTVPDGTIVPASGTIVFYASGEDITDPALDELGRLHTNFQLSDSGEYVALTAPDGTVVHEYEDVPAQYHDVSFGVFAMSQGRFTSPSPGDGNEPLAPNVENVSHAFLDANDMTSPMIVTAEVKPTISELQEVSLHYRLMYEDELFVGMVDDGAGNDKVAGDGIYTGVIPGGLAAAGQMLRYYVTASATDGLQGRAPTFVDEEASPEYYGVLIHDASLTSSFPVLNWFIESPRRADSGRGTRASIEYAGEFYDNIYVRIRGGTARSWPKRSYKIEFNDDHHFRFREGVPRVDEFNLNATYTDKTYVRARLTSEFQLDVGTPSPETFHLRVQQNGEFYSIAFFVEQPDRDFLRRHNLDADGSLYKAGPGSTYTSIAGFEKKTRPDEGRDDISEFVSGLRATGEELDRFLFDNANIPAQINFMATHVIVQNIDGSDKNHYIYRDTNGTGEWFMMPWDLDLVFGPDALNTDTIVADENTRGATYPNAVHPFLGSRAFPLHAGKINMFLDKMITNPRTREMLLRRIRTMADEYLATGYFHERIDELVGLLRDEVALDRERWGNNAHFGSNRPFEAENARVKMQFLDRRLPYLTEYHVQGGVGIPEAQTAEPELMFGETIVFDPASGNQSEEYFSITNPNGYAVDVSGWQIRGATSTTLRPGTVIPAGDSLYMAADVPAFRNRSEGPAGDQGLFVQSYESELPDTGGRLTLADRSGRVVDQTSFGTETVPASADNLRISEVNFNPHDAFVQFGETVAGGSNFEFVEFTNVSSDVIELAGVQLKTVEIEGNQEGIAFTFGSQTLAPGHQLVVVKNREAFVSRFSDVPRIADGTDGQLGLPGEFANGLGNGGETITLVDSSDRLIQQFAYDDEAGWPHRADGRGSSLEIIDLRGDYNASTNWRASVEFGGSPGRAGESASSGVVINEILANSNAPIVDQVELFNKSEVTIDIANWYVSDSGDDPLKFQFSGDQAPIAAGAYFVISEAELGFGFKGQESDDIYLIEANELGRPIRFADSVVFDETLPNTSLGRWPNGSGPLFPMRELTFGQSNPGPAELPGDFNADGSVELEDVRMLCGAILGENPNAVFDLSGDGTLNHQDMDFLIESILGTNYGDANLDGRFDSSDLVRIFQQGEYEDDIADNSDWSSGDWNCDGEFTSSDIVLAFRSGGYIAAATNVARMAASSSSDLAAAVLGSQQGSWNRTRNQQEKSGTSRRYGPDPDVRQSPLDFQAVESLFRR